MDGPGSRTSLRLTLLNLDFPGILLAFRLNGAERLL
jgi:hypothetical protein